MTTEASGRRNARIEMPGDGVIGSSRTHRSAVPSTFHGWGPKLVALALAASAFGSLEGRAYAATDPGASASCPLADSPAAIVEHPTPDIPQLAYLDGPKDVVVQIDLSASGALEGASVARSSGQSLLDMEALRVVRTSRFSPAISDCLPVESRYLYTVSFAG